MVRLPARSGLRPRGYRPVSVRRLGRPCSSSTGMSKGCERGRGGPLRGRFPQGYRGQRVARLIAWGDLRRGSCSSPGSLRHARLLSLHPPLAEAALPQMVAPGRCIRCRPRSAHFVAVEEAPVGGWEERPDCLALAAEADDEPAVVTIRHDRAPVLACCPQVVEKSLPPLQKSLIFWRLDAYMTRAP